VAQAQTPFEQGSIAYEEGQFHRAIQYWEQALSSAETPEQQAIIWGNLASAYLAVGQYQKALNANQTALSLFTELRQEDAIGLVQTNLGNVYEALGDYDRAIAAYKESLRIAQNTADREAEGIILGNLGYIYFLQGDQGQGQHQSQNQARQHYEESLNIARETNNTEGISRQLLNIGLTHHAAGDISSAKKYYQDSFDIADTINHRELIARALSSLGMAEADEGNYDTAIRNYEKSLEILEALGNPEPIARTLNNLGHTLLAAHRLDESEAKLREAISNLETLRTIDQDFFSVSLFDTQFYSYNLLQQVLVEQHKPEEALEISEAGRARAFAKLLSQQRSSSPDAELEAETDSAQINTDQIRQLAKRRNLTLIEYSLVPEDDFRVQGRQRGRTSEIHIWVIKPSGDIAFCRKHIDNQTYQPEDLVKLSRIDIGVRSRGDNEAVGDDPQDQTKNLRALYEILIDPIEALLPRNSEDKIVFIPQGDLFLVPFPALINDNGDYLIQHHTILTAPSIQVLDLTHQQADKLDSSSVVNPEEILIVGDPDMPEIWRPQSATREKLRQLFGAAVEAMNISNLLGVDYLTADEASEQAVKQRISNDRIVHLATHGLLEYGIPQDSGVRDIPGAIALAPSPGQDGLLTSAEILSELDLKAELVVLSACDTGRGDITGDGVIGLSRSIIAAGASSIVVSLWAIPDASTSIPMEDFYKQLKLGKDKAQALRLAMLTTMQNDQYRDPRNWAAFTLIGETKGVNFLINGSGLD
jgi:CHAT domain-containing protein/predicted negative regulator of RcsB-dependent stress response